MAVPNIGEVWKHFKGGCYKIIGHTWGVEGDGVPVLRIVYGKDEGPQFSRDVFNFLYREDGSRRFKYGQGEEVNTD